MIHVSIIIPTYNREAHLRCTIQSVLDQTFKNFELLICDDGSTDGSHHLVKEFQDARIKWLAGKNSGGPAIPRNNGIAAAKSEWLAFLDSDDSWEPEKLEKQLKAANDYNVKAVCTNSKVVKNNTIQDNFYFPQSHNSRLSFTDMLEVNRVICSSMLIHRSIIAQIGVFPEEFEYRGIEDYVLWLSSSMLTDIYYIDDALTQYRDEVADSLRGDIVCSDPIILDNRVFRECFQRTGKLTCGKWNFRLKIIKRILKKPYLKQRIRELNKKNKKSKTRSI